MPGLGHKSWLQFAKESVYGTAVAATQRLELIKWKVDQQIGVIRDPSLYAGQTPRGLYQGGQLAKGSFTVRCNYESLEELLRGCLPTYSFTQNASVGVSVANCTLATSPTNQITRASGSWITDGLVVGALLTDTTVPGNLPGGTVVTGIESATVITISTTPTGAAAQTVVFYNPANDHQYTDGATLNSYTLEASVGDVTAGTCFRVVGATFTGFTIKGTAGTGADAMLTVEVNVVAKDMTSGATPSRAQSLTGVTIAAGGVGSKFSAFTAPADPILVGQTVTGTGIPSGTVVVAVETTTAFYTNNVCTAGTGLSCALTLSYPALYPVLYHQAAIVNDASGDAAASVRVRNFEVSLTAPHAEDRFYLTSVNIDQPLRSDWQVTKWRMTQEFTTLSQYNQARSFAPSGGMKLLFRHPTALYSTSVNSCTQSTTTITLGSSTALYPGMVVTGTGVTPGTYIVSVTDATHVVVSTSATVSSTTMTFTAYRELELRSNSVRYTTFSAPVENYGIILSTAEAEAFKDATDGTGLLVRARSPMPSLP